MARRRWVVIVLAALIVVAPMVWLVVAQPSSRPAPAPGAGMGPAATGPAAQAPAPVPLPAEAKAVVQAYKDAKTYAATVEYTLHRKQGRTSLQQSGDQKIFLDRAAGKLTLDRPEFLLVDDGEKLRLKSDQLPQRYLEIAAPKELTLKSLVTAFPPVAEPLPVELAFLLGEDPFALLAGHPGPKVEVTEPAASGGPRVLSFQDQRGTTWKLSVDPKTNLITKVEQTYDIARLGGKPSDQASLTYNLRVDRYNQNLEANAFAFNAGGAKPVGSLTELLGLPAGAGGAGAGAATMGAGGEEGVPGTQPATQPSR